MYLAWYTAIGLSTDPLREDNRSRLLRASLLLSGSVSQSELHRLAPQGGTAEHRLHSAKQGQPRAYRLCSEGRY
jgi:hypothetical protein